MLGLVPNFMTNQSDMPTKERLNLTLLNSSVSELKQLRLLMEKRTGGRFSLAEIVSKLIADALTAEQSQI